MRPTSSAWLALAALAAACGGPDSAPGDPDATTVPPDAAAPAPDADHTVVETRSLTIGPITVPPGGEQTVCVVLDLGNATPRMIRSLRTELTAGTHHVIVTRSDEAVQPTPFSCGAFAGGGADQDVLFIAQQSEGALAYPPGSGLRIAAHQSIHLEMHYMNAQPSGDLDIAGTVHLDLAADDDSLRPINLLFTGNLSLFLPAGEQVTVNSFHDLPDGVDLFALTPHTHQWGRRAALELATSSSDPDAVLLHESTDWAERPITVIDPITITAGQGLRLTCEYDNQSGADVSFGLGAEDEMCFLWAHYVDVAP